MFCLSPPTIMLCLQHSDCSTASDSSIINTQKMTLGNVVSSRREELCCQPFAVGCAGIRAQAAGRLPPPPLAAHPGGPGQKLKPNKGLKPTKGFVCLLLTPVQLWSLLWLYGRLVPKPGQELPAPYRYLSPHTSLPVRTLGRAELNPGIPCLPQI